MSRRLIVNADDLAISAGVTRGIIETHLKGIVTSTSVMVNLPDAAESIRLAKRDAPKLGLGLHINLSFGKPALPPSEVPTLLHTTDSFCSTFDELMALSQNFDPAHVRAEIRAQFDRFVELAGHPPDHLDSHHHITGFSPAAGDALLELANEYNLPIRKHPLPVRQPDYFEGRFYDDGANFDSLAQILGSLPDGTTELMCHPGYVEDLSEAYTAPREREIKILTDPRIRAIINEEKIELITFADLSAASNTPYTSR